MRKIMLCFIYLLLTLSLSASDDTNITLYVSEQGGVSNILLYNTETAATKPLTAFQDEGEVHSISANQPGDTIIFTRPSPANGRTDSTVWSISPDGSGFSDLYSYIMGSEAGIDLRYAAVSPDGTKIAYSRNSSLSPEIYHLYIKTAAETRLLTSGFGNPVECAYPVFLDENRVLFLVKNLVDNLYDYYTVNINGSELTNLTNNNQYSPYFPRLGKPSLNDTKTGIIYAQQIQDHSGFSNWRIYTLNLDSLFQQQIFNNLYYTGIPPESQPDPQPFFHKGADIGLIGTQNGTDFDLYFTTIYSANPYMERITFSKDPYHPYFFTTQPLPEQWLFGISGNIKIRDKDGTENNIEAGFSPVLNKAGTYAAYKNNGIRIRRIGAAASTAAETDSTADYPAFSPDGKWIAYVKGNDIWARLVDMTNSPRQLTNSPLTEKRDISFSPCGRFIAYTGIDGSGTKYIYRLPVSITYGTVPLIDPTGLPSNLTPDTNDNFQPSFSPDGQNIVFISTRNQLPEIWIMNANGSGQRQIIFTPETKPQNPVHPHFSPYESSLIAYLAGTPLRVYTLDISGALSASMLFPVLTATDRFSWSKAPSGNIDINRTIVFDTYYPDIPLEYKLDISINRKQYPASFLVEETVPETWILTDVKINGSDITGSQVAVSGGKQTITWLFGTAGIAPVAGNTEIILTFGLGGDTVGNRYCLTGGATVSDRKFLTAGNAHVTLGQPYIPVDTGKNWQIEDEELLCTIDLWAKNLQVNGWPVDTGDWDFWLLRIINFWANDITGYSYKTGEPEPMWELNP